MCGCGRARPGARSGRLLVAVSVEARDRGEIHADTDIAEASEWVARVLLSLSTVPGDTLDPSDADAVEAYVRRYVMPGLRG
jgi:hypothetical protein